VLPSALPRPHWKGTSLVSAACKAGFPLAGTAFLSESARLVRVIGTRGIATVKEIGASGLTEYTDEHSSKDKRVIPFGSNKV
jgi:hypothetical protein